jgi:two-component system, LytTR family, sensor kinase
MRCVIPLIFFCLLQIVCDAQKLEMILDKVHPVIQHDSHGDSINKYFAANFYSKQNPAFTQRPFIAVFYSNKLAVNYRHALKKIPELRKYPVRDRGNIQLDESYGMDYAIPIFDSTGIIITVNGINPENAHEYEFRVTGENQQQVLNWTQPALFIRPYWMSRIANREKKDKVTAYLGQFKQEYGKPLTFEVRKKSSPDSILAAATAYWVKWKPRVAGVFTFAQLPEFLNVFKKQWNSGTGATNHPDWSSDTTLLKLKKDFRHDENNLIFYLDDIISSKKIIEYNLVNGSDSTGWMVNDFDFNLIWLKNLSPAKYVLKVRYSVQRQNVCYYTFLVRAAWYQTLWAKTGMIVIGLAALGFLLLLWRSKKQARKLKAQGTQKQLVQTELKSIRSQFNPHFVFNALSSIQGLITKNDPENASKYLIEFSNLMRDSLKASNNEFVSIASEIKILENYLKLEKLRFGFSYNIAMNKEIDASAVEIPSLFLQPLVENAVKHGISALQEQGVLTISFEKKDNDMVVFIKDNGKGFKTQRGSGGFGLALTKERIKLLNQTLNDQAIEFLADRVNELTQVTIHFKNWLI